MRSHYRDGRHPLPGLPAAAMWLAGFLLTPLGAAQPIVILSPLDNVQQAVDGNPPGTIFQFTEGTFRLVSIRSESRNIFRGTLGPNGKRLTILSGAKLLGGFTRRAAPNGRAYWVVGGQAQQGQVHGECQPAYPRCNRPEDVFINDQPLTHAGSLEDLGPGKYFFDYDRNAIYLFDDPTGQRVETSVAEAAFIGPNASDLLVENLIVEKYANPPQFGAIGHQYPGPGWIVRNNEVRRNHGVGIHVGARGQALHNYIHDNGQLGLGAGGDDVLVEGNEIARNRNYIGVGCQWECGGFKFTLTRRLTARGNYVHHNAGPGIWADTDALDTLYENNIVVENWGPGIFHEISHRAVIRNNIVVRNGWPVDKGSGWLWDAQIQISTSQDVEIYGNRIEADSAVSSHGIVLSQQRRGVGPYGEYRVANNYVHDNDITVTGGGPYGLSGAVADYNGPAMFGRSAGNRFDGNRYHVPVLDRAFWAWNGKGQTFAGFRAEGHESRGSVDTKVVSWPVPRPARARGTP